MKFAHAFALLASALIVAACSVSWAEGSLAAYSETRSFRDALDGRSMEEAISGPVDKDTSSYGDRTAASSGANSQQGQQQLPVGPMMLSIPANGNLNGQMPVEQSQQQEQPTKSTGPMQAAQPEAELEREAGPVSAGGQMPMDGQQQMMELKASQAERPVARSGRLSAPPMMGARRAGRQRQQPEAEYAAQQAAGVKSAEAGGFGDDSSAKQPKGYSRTDNKAAGSTPSYGDEQQQQTSAGEQQPQQQSDERSYPQMEAQVPEEQQQLAKQKAMAAMLMSMTGYTNNKANSGANPMSTSGGSQYGDKRSAMAQSMMSSLASKAAYMNQQQSARPAASQGYGMSPMSPMSQVNQMNQMSQMNQMNQMNQMSQMSQMNQMNVMNQMGQAPASGQYNAQASRPMRRANQRRASERKMSPAMVNAMLNKMMSSARQADQTDGYGAAKAMKAPEMAMANLMMAQQPVGGATAGMSAAKKDQYKRMMMAALMMQQQQQQQQESDYAGQVTTTTESAAQPSTPSSKLGGYASSTMAPPAATAMRPAYGSQPTEPQRQVDAAPAMGGYGQRPRPSDYEQQRDQREPEQQRAQMDGYSPVEQQQVQMMMMMGERMAGDKAAARRPTGSAYQAMKSRPAPARYADLDAEQRRTPMSVAGANYAERDQQQQREPSPSAGAKMGAQTGGEAYAPQQQPAGGYGAGKSAMARPASGQQRDAYEQQDEEQQQEADYPGAAPVGQAEPFAFDYKIEDDYGNGQYRKEESDKNGVVRGSYGYTDVSGIYRHVEYIADENGFRANIKSNEPGLSSPESTKSAAGGSGPMGRRPSTESAGQQPQQPMQMSLDGPAGSGQQQAYPAAQVQQSASESGQK